ncbi:Hypothetical predicted protein [Mytilus galloprovincialis]|uniref:H-type lectin domain-containing protein n=1 Tax=Mytilus galloprovincialis TaxID=29158 RepID=A0A8B6FPG5_MYTGA|nr:Hypothetical predicted protein [Mytilus galloprovincialis]
MRLVFIFITVCIVTAYGSTLKFESSPSSDDDENEVEAPMPDVAPSSVDDENEVEAPKPDVTPSSESVDDMEDDVEAPKPDVTPSSDDDMEDDVEALNPDGANFESKGETENEFQALKSEVSMLETEMKEVRRRHYHPRNAFRRHRRHHHRRHYHRRHGCVSGTAQLGYSGRRNKQRVMYIRFRRPFRRTPALVVGMTSLDTYRGTNVRVTTKVLHLSNHGFILHIKTWGGSITYNVVYTWMACPK